MRYSVGVPEVRGHSWRDGLAESSSNLITQALERAIAAPEGLPLFAGKQTPGLFPSAAAGKEAALRARSAELVRVVRTEGKGKSAVEICALTEKGLAHLLEQSSPRPVLESLLKAIENCEAQVSGWIAAVADNRAALDGLRGMAERVLTHLNKPEASLPSWARNGHHDDPERKIVDVLRAWHAAGRTDDHPLPELFEVVRGDSKLTLGRFHDSLRALHEKQTIYLHPWTGPLHELPRPAAALLVGHEIAYYASLRS